MGEYINYPGFCKSRYARAALPAAYVAPPLIQAGIDMMNRQPFMLNDTAVIWGALGFLAGAAIHLPANRYASRHQYGMTRGSRLVRTWQAAAYGAVVAGGLTLMNATEEPLPEPVIQVAPEKLTDFHN